MPKTVKETAEEHWVFNERWLHMVYVDTFVHGEKHGCENMEERIKEAIRCQERCTILSKEDSKHVINALQLLLEEGKKDEE